MASLRTNSAYYTAVSLLMTTNQSLNMEFKIKPQFTWWCHCAEDDFFFFEKFVVFLILFYWRLV